MGVGDILGQEDSMAKLRRHERLCPGTGEWPGNGAFRPFDFL